MFVSLAKIDNGFDAQSGKTRPRFCRGLATAEDALIGLVEVGDASNFDTGWGCGEGQRQG
jgi:hypothetical protein